MKKILPIVAIGFLVLLATLLFLSEQKSQSSQSAETDTQKPSEPLTSPSLDPSLVGTENCSTQDIEASISFEGAAGTIHTTATLKNISESTCQIQANNFIAARYQSNKENIQVTNTGVPTLSSYDLPSDQVLTAQISYPNGPQCSVISQVQTTFTYDIGEGDVTFQDSERKTTFPLQTCQSTQEITTITISPFSASN